MTTPDTSADPHRILKAFSTLGTLIGIYPAGHPLVTEKIREIEDAVSHLKPGEPFRIDVIRGVLYVNGVEQERATETRPSGIDSLHLVGGVRAEEIAAAADVVRRADGAREGGSVRQQLAGRGVEHVSVGRLVPLDTRWRANEWPERPTTALDPDYEQSLAMAEQAFEQMSAKRTLDVAAVRDLVRLLMCRVVTSNAALAQILSVKQYENLTYIHSVNVAVLSLLLGRRVGLDEPTLARLVEAAVLHDVGKTRIPLALVKKPGALDAHERKLMQAHTVFGAELLAQVDGLDPLAPLVALEHHRGVLGDGYPDLGQGVVPHALSQIVSVADVYEAVTGARTYQAPTPPERACLLLARLAGHKLNAALVRAFVNTITFFPAGSLVRTSRDELAVVTRTNPHDPLHPIVQLVDEGIRSSLGEVDTSTRDDHGAYVRHIARTVVPTDDSVDVTRFLPAA